MPRILALTLLFTWVCAACMTTVSVYVSRQDTDKYQQFTLDELLRQGETLIATADRQRLAQHTPLHYAKLHTLWTQVQAVRGAPQQRATVIRHIAEMEKLVVTSQTVAASVLGLLHDPLALATDIEALALTGDVLAEFRTVNAQLHKLVERVELGQGAWLGQEPERVKTQLSRLLVRAHRQVALHDAEQTLYQLLEQGAGHHIPKTLQAFRQSLRDAGEYIERYPKNALAIAGLRTGLAHQGRRALALLSYVKDNALRARLALEQLVLEEEARLQHIAQAMGVTTVGDSLPQMAATLAIYAQRLAATEGAEARLAQVQELAALKERVQQLQADKLALEKQLTPLPPGAAPPLPPPLVTQ